MRHFAAVLLLSGATSSCAQDSCVSGPEESATADRNQCWSKIVSRLSSVKGPGLNFLIIMIGLYGRVCGLMTRDGGDDVKTFTLDEEAC